MYKNGGVRDLLCPIKDLYERKNGRSKVFEMVPTYLDSKECYLCIIKLFNEVIKPLEKLVNLSVCFPAVNNILPDTTHLYLD